jgi:hypothetical protein
MTNDTECLYPDRESHLIGYLYDDLPPDQRVTFGAHVASCLICREELAALGAVRTGLTEWVSPEPARRLQYMAVAPDAPRARWGGIGRLPTWAQVAAALLVGGVAAGAANLDIRYDESGLSVRTGWAERSVSPVQQSAAGDPADAAWRGELQALERDLRDAIATASAASDAHAAVTQQVSEMVAASEQRQQRALALRVAEVMRDVDTQRRADREKIDYNLNMVQSGLVDVMRNYAVQASQQQQQQR